MNRGHGVLVEMGVKLRGQIMHTNHAHGPGLNVVNLNTKNNKKKTKHLQILKGPPFVPKREKNWGHFHIPKYIKFL